MFALDLTIVKIQQTLFMSEQLKKHYIFFGIIGLFMSLSLSLSLPHPANIGLLAACAYHVKTSKSSRSWWVFFLKIDYSVNIIHIEFVYFVIMVNCTFEFPGKIMHFDCKPYLP